MPKYDAVSPTQEANDVAVLIARGAVRAATTAVLAANTYANGTLGVGATLTANANGALAAQDGVTLVAGDRLLVKDEVAGANNGVYTVTVVGTGLLPYILTRYIGDDVAAEIEGSSVFVEAGTVNGGTLWACTNASAPTIGATALTYAKIGGTLITVAGGGTGATTFTDAGVLIGNGTSAVQVTTAGTAGQVLTSNGAGVDPTFQAAAGGGISFFLPGVGTAVTRWAVVAGTWTNSGADGDGMLGNTMTNGSADALNDKIRKKLAVPVTGTWKARVVANTGPAAGIWSLQLDTTEKGTWDQYAAAGTYNQWSSEISLGSLTANQVYDLELKVTGKNGASSGYETNFIGVLIYQ